MNDTKKSFWCCFPRRRYTRLQSGQLKSTRCGHNSAFAWLEGDIRGCREPEVVRVWIGGAEDINVAVPNTGMTPLELALESCNAPVIEMLLENGAMVDVRLKYNHSPVFCACAWGYLIGVKLLVTHGADFRARFSNGLTCLLVAARNRHFAVVSYLLQLDYCGVSEVDDEGYSALHYASVYNQPSTVSKLIQNGASINAQNAHGESPLFLAVQHDCLDALQVLLEVGANPNTSTKYGDFALFRATRECNIDAMRMLLARGVDVKQKYQAQWTPLQVACDGGFLEPVKLLVENGADISARIPNGLTCLLLAAQRRNFSVVSYLIEHDSCPVHDDEENGFTVLHHVVLMNDTETTSIFISKGVDINAQTQDGETPVFLATKNSCWNSLRVLLEAGANPNISDKNWDYALHVAVERGCTEAVRMLLKHGADKTRTTMYGSTPLDLAHLLKPPSINIIIALFEDSQVKQRGEDRALDEYVAKQRLKSLERKVEQCIYCPITFEVMRDPVIAEDGHTYERKAIETWLRQKQESPVTRQFLTSSVLIPNLAVKHLISQKGMSPTN